jgi:2-methylcitrate dehydratase PrpD
MSLTRSLGQFVASLSPGQIPEPALEIARTGFIDCIGVMIAGREEAPTRLLRQVLAPTGNEATLCFTASKADAPQAAWINGTAAHALDFDDVALRSHLSTVLVPAILAEAEALDLSGRDMLTAYVAGYEVWAELIRREKGLHHGKGWHPTGIFGSIGAAAACAWLRRLNPQQTAQALALGASQSAGLMANFGSMTKPFHAGRAAHGGVIAARLAAQGFTGAEDALEHAQGFLSAVSPAGEVDRASPPAGLGKTWRIIETGLNIKKYPTCYCTHRAIDGLLDLLDAHPLRPEEIAGITVRISENYATILRNHRPQTGLEAKFSMEFAMAGAVTAHRVGLTELTDAFVQRPDVQALMGRVGIETNTDYDPAYPGASFADEVLVRLDTGAELPSERVTRARGHAEKPLRANELFAKFENCLAVGQCAISPATLFERLQTMENGSACGLAFFPPAQPAQ